MSLPLLNDKYINYTLLHYIFLIRHSIVVDKYDIIYKS